jgi:signal transduction histidine kinase
MLTLVHRRSWSAREVLVAAGLVAGAIVTTQLIFGRTLGPVNMSHPLEYILFPFVIAAAVAALQPVTSMVVLSTSALAIWNTVHGAGPFASPMLHDSLVQLQVFVGVLAGTGLLLASAINERTMGERRRGAAHGVGEVLARAADFESAAPEVLRTICEHLEWQMGVLWIVDDDDRHLRCVSVWSEPSLSAASFADMSRNLVFPLGVGLPGRILATGTAAWIENVDSDPNFPRAHVAREAGVHGAFAFPIRLAGRIEAVIEFFNRSVVPPDADLLRTMSTVGNQIGQFIGRKRQEAAVAAAERERTLLLRREAAARNDAEAANRAKDQFLATLSHELRTPMNAILGWTRMLRDRTMDPADTQRALEVIDRNAHLQAQLIEDILDVSRIITGGLQLNRAPVDLLTIVGAAIDAVRPSATAKNVRLSWAGPQVPVVVNGDPKRLEQAVWNLLVNSVKFTEAAGSVSVSMTTIDDRVRITVSDDGIGIDPQFLPHVFERFRQADASDRREQGGLGIGLAIVHHLIGLHGGTIEAESPGIGRGATFTIELSAMSRSEEVRL